MARRAGSSPLPPPLEMACLGVLWVRGEGTVRDVAAGLAPRHSFAYTTVMTLLERLVRRRQLSRRKQGRSFVYTPVQDPEELRSVAVEEFVRSYFGGSRDELRRWLDGSTRKEALEVTGANDPIDTALL